jgi:hypothetical protein
MKHSFAVVMLLALALAGCTSPQERARRAAIMQAELDQADNQKCTSWGAKPGTDAYIKCRLELTTSRQHAVATVAAAQTQARAIENATPSHCTSTAIGGTVSTNCF